MPQKSFTQLRKSFVAGATAAVAALTVFTAPMAAAGGPAGTAQTGKALAGPGAPIRLQEFEPDLTINYFGHPIMLPPEAAYASCSQAFTGTAIGPNGEPVRVMMTASHCLQSIEEGAVLMPSVYAPTTEGLTRIGATFQTSNFGAFEDDDSTEVALQKLLNEPDWGTVLLDDGVVDTRVSQSRDQFGGPRSAPVELTGIRDWRNLGPREISFDNAFQPICKDGMTTGRTCGTQVLRTRHAVWIVGIGYDNGDSGGVNYDPVTGEVIGITSQTFGWVNRAQPADIAIEEAFGIKDGEVNKHFRLTDSTAKHAEFTNLRDEAVAIDTVVVEQMLAAPPVDVEAEQRAFDADVDAELANFANRAGGIAYDAVTTGNLPAAQAQVDQLITDAIDTGAAFSERYEQIQVAANIEQERARRAGQNAS